ncbi:MAG: hypothetical protein IKB01_03290, partial [Lachnospiraceae bacterium]|nr:hypothetical protein [Lachnospiraceae bacterium]
EESATGKYTKCQVQDGDKWFEDRITLPEGLEGFSYQQFHFVFGETVKGAPAQYAHASRTITVKQGSLKENILLHEMIHLHVHVLNEQPMYYRDIVYWELYRELKKQIPDLDERIETHAHILNEQCIHNKGGEHDVLFLLKSFDLDLKKGYELGTVFGYGMVES